MTPRDPIAELWAANPRTRSSSSLSVPVKHPTGSLVWLSVGQWMTLLYLRRRMRFGRGETTYAAVAAATGTHPGAVTHRFDRLAQLGLIGRHATVGRGHRTRYWPPSSLRGPRTWTPAVNVATSTAYGGSIRAYVTRDGLRARARRGGIQPDPPAGGPSAGLARRRPPRLIYEPCPRDGGAARLTAWRWSLSSDRLTAVWDGTCPRCGALVVAPLVVELGDRWAMDSAGAILDRSPIRLSGGARTHRPRAAAPTIPPGPRLDRLRSIAAETVAAGELDADGLAAIGARWLGWRPVRNPEPPVLVGDVAERDALRSAAWSSARDHHPVRYSNPVDDVDDVDSSVRDSQPGPAMPDPSSTDG